MAGRKGRELVIVVAIITCVATVTSVTWLSRLIAAQHKATVTEYQLQGRAFLLEDTKAARVVRGTVTEGTAFSGGQLNSLDIGQVRQQQTQATTTAAQSVEKSNTGSSQPSAQCRPLPNTDYWGDALEWGSKNKKETAEECCNACLNYKPLSETEPGCNVWVYCGDKESCKENYQECWLKHLLHPEGSQPKTGAHIPWMSGVFGLPMPMDYESLTQEGGQDRSFHVVVTAQGPATHWQARVHYYWYKKIQKQCQSRGVCHMGGWTRLLHSGEPDELMGEIPTHVVKPLIDKDNKGYVVLNRPWAFVQWLREVTVPEKYIFMSEPDHIWLKPLPNLMLGSKPAAFPFFYIEPAKADYVHITEKFTGKLTRQQIESISPIGNAPTLLTYADLKRVAETWMNTSHAIFDDEEAHKAWGWVLEMYGFTIACYKAGIQPATLHLKLMSQPPWDNDLPWGPSFYILHYTYGMDYTKDGKFTPGKIGEWRFDKRTYSELPPPRNLEEPPPGLDNTLVHHLISAINEASAAIPGWDDYAKTGVAKQFWDGKL